MLLNNINSIPQIVLLRNDKVLLQLVNTIIHNKSLKKGFNELFEGIRDYYPNRYRLEEIEFAIKQKEFESSKINSINYNFNFMEHLFNNFFKYDGSNIYVKDEIIEEYSKTITKVSPLQIIGYKLSKDLNEANLSINDLILYINNYTPLGFKVEKSVKYAENHLHLKGSSYVSFNMSKLFNYKTPKKFFKKKFLKEIPRINEFSLINNNNISIGHIID